MILNIMYLQLTQRLGGGVITGEPAVTDVLMGAAGVFDGLLPLPARASDTAATPPATARIAIRVPYVLPGEVTLSFPPPLGNAACTAGMVLGSTDRIEEPSCEFPKYCCVWFPTIGCGISCADNGERLTAAAIITT
jgi:hypothetical protein